MRPPDVTHYRRAPRRAPGPQRGLLRPSCAQVTTGLGTECPSTRGAVVRHSSCYDFRMQPIVQRASWALSLSALVGGACASFAQSPGETSTPKFEVASIKRARPEPGAIGPGSVRLLPFYASGKL